MQWSVTDLPKLLQTERNERGGREERAAVDISETDAERIYLAIQLMAHLKGGLYTIAHGGCHERR